MDAEALDALDRAAPDGGFVAFSSRPHVPRDAVDLGLYRTSVELVAEAGDPLRVVGAARAGLGRCRVNGEDAEYALLSGLNVHPGHRRQGVAAALARERIAWARAMAGPDVVLLATIQAGNTASLAAARRWATQLTGRLVVAPVPVRRRAPRNRHGLVVRAPHDHELPEVADVLARTRAGYGLSGAETADGLRRWLATSPLPDAVHHYRVAVDGEGRLLAGMALREVGRVVSLVVERMPPAVRLANSVLHVVPAGGEMRNVAVSKVWFVDGALEAARYLWQTCRWEWRERATGLLSVHDPRGPMPSVMQAPRWLPTTAVTLAVRAPRPLADDALIDLP